jgi:hypothetical protein
MAQGRWPPASGYRRLEPTCRDEDEAGVKRSHKVKSRAEKFSKLLKISKWQNSVKPPFHRGILAKATASMAFERSHLAWRKKFQFSRSMSILHCPASWVIVYSLDPTISGLTSDVALSDARGLAQDSIKKTKRQHKRHICPHFISQFDAINKIINDD